MKKTLLPLVALLASASGLACLAGCATGAVPKVALLRNPALTEQTVADAARARLAGSRIDALAVQRTTAGAIAGLPDLQADGYTPDSTVWLVRATGAMKWPFAGPNRDGTASAQQLATGQAITMVLDGAEAQVVSMKMEL